MRQSIPLFLTSLVASVSVVHAATPLACRVEARSVQGGRVWATRLDHSPKLPFDMQLRVFWQPPSTSNAIEMVVGGDGGEALGELTGGHVTFTPQVTAHVDHYTVRVRANGGDVWTYSSADMLGGPEKVSVPFDRNTPRGQGILKAFRNGAPIAVEILRGSKIEQSVTFDPSNITERDKLVAYASHLVETNDARVCKAI